MNRAFLIITVPLALVVIGYCLVFWRMAMPFAMGQLLVAAIVLFAAAAWWIVKRSARKKGAGA